MCIHTQTLLSLQGAICCKQTFSIYKPLKKEDEHIVKHIKTLRKEDICT